MENSIHPLKGAVMSLSGSELAIYAVSGAFVILVVFLIYLIVTMKRSLDVAIMTLNSLRKSMAEISDQLGPAIQGLAELQASAKVTLDDIRKKSDIVDIELVPLLQEATSAARELRVMEESLNGYLNGRVEEIVENTNETAKNAKDISQQVRKNIEDTREFFDSVRETGQTLRMVSSLVRGGVTGAAVQLASMATGIRSSVEYLAENISKQKGGEKR